MAHRRLRTGGALAAALTIISILAPSAIAADGNPFETGDPVGDGFAVIPTETRIFNVNHHDETRVECRELQTGARCAGYPFAHPSLAETGLAPHGTIDAATGRLWVAAQMPGGAKEIGFACIDIGVDSLATPTSCGWVSTGTGALAIDPDRGGSIHSGDEYNRKLYAIDTDGTIHCVDMAAGTACAGQPYDVGLPDSDGAGTHLTRIGDTSKFIARTSPAGLFTGPSSLICFDPDKSPSPGVCAGWSGPITMGSGSTTVNASVISAQVGDTWDAFCGIPAQDVPSANVGSTSINITCRSLADGGSVSAPAPMVGLGLTAGSTGWQFGIAGMGEADTYGTRVYFTLTRFLGFTLMDVNDRLVCYDYATDAFCPGYPSDFFGGRPGQTESRTYAASVDAAGTCVWTLGDEGVPVHHKVNAPNERCYTWTDDPPPPPPTTTTTTTPPTTTTNTTPTLPGRTKDDGSTIPQSVGCAENKLLLTDVFPRGGKTRLLGIAPLGSAGQRVTLRSAWNGKVVAKPKVTASLMFSATVPLPPKRIRFGNKARYVATYGKEKSLVLKFARRMYTTGVTQKGKTLTYTGLVTKPLAKPIRKVVLRASASCSTLRKGKIVATVMPAKNGVFKARFKQPAGLTKVFLRAQTRVRRYANRKSTSDTFTLIRGVKVTP